MRPRKVDRREGRIAVAGLISTHNHAFQNLCKGIGDELAVWPIVEGVILATAEEMNVEEIYIASLACCIEGMRSGRTTLLDFMVGLPDIEHQRAVLRAFRDSGIRGFLGRATRELHHEASHRDPWYIPLGEALDQITALAGEYDNGLGKPSALPAPGNPRTMTTDGLIRITEYALARGCLITTHLAEYDAERGEGSERWGMSTIAKLEEIGFLGPAARRGALRDPGRRRARGARAHRHEGLLQPCEQLLLRCPDRAGRADARDGDRRQHRRRRGIRELPEHAREPEVRRPAAEDGLRRRDGDQRPRHAQARDGRAARTRSACRTCSGRSRWAGSPTSSSSTSGTSTRRRCTIPISMLVYAGGPQNVDTLVDRRRRRARRGALYDASTSSRSIQELQERSLAVSTRAAHRDRFLKSRRFTPFRDYERVGIRQPSNGAVPAGAAALHS